MGPILWTFLIKKSASIPDVLMLEGLLTKYVMGEGIKDTTTQ